MSEDAVVDPLQADKEKFVKAVTTAAEQFMSRVDKKTKKRKRKVVDPNRPKQPQSSFFLFREAKFDEVKKENPESKITELAKILGTRWKALADKDKEVYQKIYEKNKIKWKADMVKYEAAVGVEAAAPEGKKAAKKAAKKPKK